MEKTSVNLLRRAGFGVKVRHYRFYDRPVLGGWQRELLPMSYELPSGEQPCPRGGMTQVALTFPSGKIVFAQANCSPKDPYNRKHGVKVCLGRLQKQLAQ